MENLLHLTPSYTSLPDRFIIPLDLRMPATSAAVSLPLIDLSRSRDEAGRAILNAGREFGFFQVVNHGVSDLEIRDMESVCEEFFRLPAADKADLYAEDSRRPNRLFSGTSYDTGGEKYWRDCLHLSCSFPIGSSTTEGWPEKPQMFREVVEKFAVATRGAGMELLRLLCEAIGLRPDYFEGDISGGDLVLRVNHYPRCPDPSAALGLPPHCDRNLITLLLPGTVPGLQIAYNGDWIKVDPVPNAFVVNFGKQLEVVTNGALKSIEHRVATNAAQARTSVATFIMPTGDCLIGPAEEFLGEGDLPCYRTLTFSDYMRIHNVVKLGPSHNQKDI